MQHPPELMDDEVTDAAGAAVALSALWTLGDMMKDGLLPKAN